MGWRGIPIGNVVPMLTTLSLISLMTWSCTSIVRSEFERTKEQTTNGADQSVFMGWVKIGVDPDILTRFHADVPDWHYDINVQLMGCLVQQRGIITSEGSFVPQCLHHGTCSLYTIILL